MISRLRHKYNVLKYDYVPRWRRYCALRRFLPAQGFFVEAGANDGIAQSNTSGLETWAAWHGLLVEPVPALADRCRRNRPKCLVETCALVSADYAAPTVELWDCNLMSLVKGSRSEDEEREHLRKGESYQGLTSTLVTAPARTLSALLDRHNVSTVDFLSLDLEGYELSALQGLDLGRHAPRFLLIEAGDRPEIQRFLGPLFRPVATLGDDTLFQRSGEGKR